MKRRRDYSPDDSRKSGSEDDSRPCRRRRRRRTHDDDSREDLLQAVRNLQKVAERLERRDAESKERRRSKKRHRTPSPHPAQGSKKPRLDKPMSSTGESNWAKPSRLQEESNYRAGTTTMTPVETAGNTRGNLAQQAKRTNSMEYASLPQNRYPESPYPPPTSDSSTRLWPTVN